MTTASPWWAPHRHADRRPRLLARNAIAAAIRDWFARRDFVEVQTAALQISPGNETHLSAFATEAVLPDTSRSPLYLHTSPEFACKKLLAAGEEKIFSFGPVWRNRERGRRTIQNSIMLEWYRAGETYGSLMEDCAALLSWPPRKPARNVCLPRPRVCSLRRAERLVADAFPATPARSPRHGRDRRRHRPRRAHAAVSAAGLRTAPDDT